MSPRVSVITPFVAEGPLLAEAIRSVVAQTFDDWELILVDDAPDETSLRDDAAASATREIATRCATADPQRVRVLDADCGQRGAAAARNRGIEAARSDLIAFLDADDVFLPDKLGDEAGILDAHPEAAMVYARTRWWYDGSRGWDWTERLGVEADRVHAPPSLLVSILLEQRGDIPCTCGVLIRKQALVETGGFEQRFALYEDQALWAKLFLAYPVYTSRACHALYRQHPRSVSAQALARGDYDPYRGHAAQDAFFAWLGTYVTGRDAAPEIFQAVYRAKVASRRPPPGRLRVLASWARKRVARA